MLVSDFVSVSVSNTIQKRIELQACYHSKWIVRAKRAEKELRKIGWYKHRNILGVLAIRTPGRLCGSAILYMGSAVKAV